MATFAGRYAEALFFGDGTLAKGVLVAVNNAGTSVPATLYSDHTRATLVANPIITDSANAMCDFYADPGLYDLYTPGGVVYGVPVVPDSGEYADLDATGKVPASQLPVGAGPNTVAAGDDPRITSAVGYSISGGTAPLEVETTHRLWANHSITLSAGAALIAMFTPEATLPLGQLTSYLVGASATGVTVARMGLYLLDSTGANLVCIARTASDVTLWGGSQEQCSRAIVDNGATVPTTISQVTLLRGQRYGFAAIVDHGATRAPTLLGGLVGATTLAARAPALAYVGPSGDSDLRATYATSALTATGAVLYGLGA